MNVNVSEHADASITNISENKNDAKNLKVRNIIVRAVSFVIYFLVAGFAGKLATIFVSPVVKLFTKDNPGIEIIMLYAAGVIVMFALLCFFSVREGDNDTELLRFSPMRALLSYVAASLVFLLICLILYYTGFANYIGSDESIFEYFFKPYFIPVAAVEAMKNIEINGNYFFGELLNFINIYIEDYAFFIILTIFLGLIFTWVSYIFGRISRIKREKNTSKRNAEAEIEMAMKIAIGTNTAAEEDININNQNSGISNFANMYGLKYTSKDMKDIDIKETKNTKSERLNKLI